MKLKQIMQVGIPAGLQGVLFSLANVTVQSSINSFDDTVLVAGSSASSSVENFVYANVNAFYQANTAFTSQNFGAGNYKRILKVRHTAVAAGVLSTSLLGWLAILFGHQLLGIYSTSPDVVQAGMLRMWFLLILYGLDALMDVQVGSMLRHRLQCDAHAGVSGRCLRAPPDMAGNRVPDPGLSSN